MDDDLDKYLALPPEANLDLDVLAWWKRRRGAYRKWGREATSREAKQ